MLRPPRIRLSRSSCPVTTSRTTSRPRSSGSARPWMPASTTTSCWRSTMRPPTTPSPACRRPRSRSRAWRSCTSTGTAARERSAGSAPSGPGSSCAPTITLAFLPNQHDVRYVPIEYAKRAGTSKFRFVTDAYRYILQVLRMVMYFNPLKVLMPVALLLLGLGTAKGIYDLAAHPFRLAIDTILIFVTGLLIASLALLADLIVRSRGDT